MSQAAHHPVLFAESGDFDGFLDRIRQGDTLSKAADYVGYKWVSVQRMIQQKPELQQRFVDAWNERSQAKADQADDRVEELVYKDNPPPAIVALWARRHNHLYREKVEFTGNGGGPIEVEAKASPFSQLSAEDLEALVRAARTKQIADAEIVDADADEG